MVSVPATTGGNRKIGERQTVYKEQTYASLCKADGIGALHKARVYP